MGSKFTGLSLQHQFSKYPGVSRDVALLCDAALTHGQVVGALAACQSKGLRYLEDWELFDCYQGPHVPPGKKSLAYRLNFRSPDKTLTDPEIEAEVSKIVGWLTEKLGVSQR